MENEYRRTPAEVAAEAAVKHTGKGLLHQVKGGIKEAWGKVTHNQSLKLEGKAERITGRVQEGLGRFEAREAEFEGPNDEEI